MILGILMSLFIGFQRPGQFFYIRTDAIIRGIMNVAVPTVAGTFRSYLRSLAIILSEAIQRYYLD